MQAKEEAGELEKQKITPVDKGMIKGGLLDQAADMLPKMPEMPKMPNPFGE